MTQTRQPGLLPVTGSQARAKLPIQLWPAGHDRLTVNPYNRQRSRVGQLSCLLCRVWCPRRS